MVITRHFRSLSWGYHAPGGIVLWWMAKPSRHLHIPRELAFEQMDESDLASAVKRIDRELFIAKIAYTVGTPAILPQHKKRKRGFMGESIGMRLAACGMPIVAADDDTLNGWKRCHALLRPSPDGLPWLTIDPSCKDLIRAIPTSLVDDKNADDVQNPAPALLAFRYGAMSHPAPERAPSIVTYPQGSAGWYLQEGIKESQRSRRFGHVA